MFENRKKELATLLVVTIGIAGFLIYKNYIAPSEQSTIESEVKGDEVIVPNSAVAEPYADSEAEKHLRLTPSNIVWFTNYYRVKNGIKPLRMQDRLNRSAHQKNLDMIVYDYFDHSRTINKKTKDFSGFMDDQNYEFIKVGENLARGDFNDSRDVVGAWMNSESHRRNILDSTYTEIGVSIDQGSIGGVSAMLFTQHFGFPKKSCPAVSSSVKSAIDAMRDEIDDLADEITSKESELGDSKVNDPNYNERVDEYNAMVNSYNSFVSQLQNLVATYNAQVQKYDICIKGR